MGSSWLVATNHNLAPLQTTINKGVRLFTGARLSTAIGPLLVENWDGSLLTRSLVSRVRLLDRSVTKRTPSMPSAPVQTMMFTLNVQGQLVRSQRWFWSRRTKQLYRNRYWLIPQVTKDSQATTLVCIDGDSTNMWRLCIAPKLTTAYYATSNYSAHPLPISWWSVSKWLAIALVWTSTSNSEITTQTTGSRTRSGCGECIYLAPREVLNSEADLGQLLVGWDCGA
ncbi:hypothetical protein BASA83_001258 [Batrachochytrium salamandrivorans]|nr:hypothetical protein BASA83_001258 [Batrachochytrium salamandrivorans]